MSIEKFVLANHVVFPESFEHRGFNRAHAAIGSSAFSPSPDRGAFGELKRERRSPDGG
jgi:hypothetical protein